jgi:hypothetical protein
MSGQPDPSGRSSVFADDEPVLQSMPLLPRARPPLFGETQTWDFNDVLRRPARLLPGQWRLSLMQLTEVQNLLARELAMIEFNPRHPKILARGLHLQPRRRKVGTVQRHVGILRALATFGAGEGLPEDFGHWSTADFHRYLIDRREHLDLTAVRPHVLTIKLLHRLAPALTNGGLTADPWPGQTGAQVLELSRNRPLRTPVIPPQTWFPLIHSAWTYIDTFGPDILRARAYWRDLQATARPVPLPEARQLCEKWLADPSHRIPVWLANDMTRNKNATTTVNWSVLATMIGVAQPTTVFAATAPHGRQLRARVEELAAEGRTQSGLLCDLTQVDRPDGTAGPWCMSLYPQRLWIEFTALRNAALVFVTALSMMRDSEVREVLKDSVVEHYGSPAVKSTLHKLTPNLPVKHWWIIEPVAQAIRTAAELSVHDTLAFASVQAKSPIAHLDSCQAITSFLQHVNCHRDITGLPAIPEQKLSPHMFRRTMAMLTRDFPGSEIAVGMQLKHAATRALANTTTQGYTEPTPAWASHLTTAISERRFEQLKELFDADGRGENIGYGPGADQLRDAFATVRTQAEHLRANQKAQRGDLRVEYGLLRQVHLTVRFGKLNHCTMDEANPVGAKCLEDAVVPEGHQGPLIDRCQPARCARSIIAPAHLPIWTAERASIKGLLTTPKLPANRRKQLAEQLNEVERVLRRTTS